MNKLKFILVGVLPILFTSCTNLNQSGNKILQTELSSSNTPVAQASNKVVNGKGTLEGWEIVVSNVKSEGQIIREEFITYEAVDTWTVVSVSIKNTTGKRQRREKGLSYLLSAKLIDANGKLYENDQFQYSNSSDSSDKPFSLDETRSVKLLFDTPKDIKPKYLFIESLSAAFEKNSISIALSD